MFRFYISKKKIQLQAIMEAE